MTHTPTKTNPMPLEPEPKVIHQLEGKWQAVSPHQVWQQLEIRAGKITIKVKAQPGLRGYFSLVGQQLEVTLTSGVASGRTIEFITDFIISDSVLKLEFAASSFEFQRAATLM